MIFFEVPTELRLRIWQLARFRHAQAMIKVPSAWNCRALTPQKVLYLHTCNGEPAAYTVITDPVTIRVQLCVWSDGKVVMSLKTRVIKERYMQTAAGSWIKTHQNDQWILQ